MRRLSVSAVLAIVLTALALLAPTPVSGQGGNTQRTLVALAGVDGLPKFVPATASSVAVNITTATTTQLVALSGTTSVYVTGASLAAVGNATPVTAKFVYGTGSNCGTGTTDLTGPFTSGTVAGAVVPILLAQSITAWFRTAAGTALCLTSTGTAGLTGVVSYQQF
jgi:hypothetical protein